jgi:hypothetical protein
MRHRALITTVKMTVVCLGLLLGMPTPSGAAEQSLQQPGLSSPEDVHTNISEKVPPSSQKRIAEVDMRQGQRMEEPVQHQDMHNTEGMHNYRPLCSPALNAINHVYCARGYDSY